MAAGEVESIRRMIDRLDSEIMRLLKRRMELCRRMGAVKRAAGMPFRDHAREADILSRAGRFRGVYRAVIDLCVEEQGGV